MTWYPTSYVPTQYVDASGDPYSGAVLKAYSAGTTTVISMATSYTGGTTATSFALNASGYTVSSGSVIIPHVQETYKLVLYPTQAAADANSGALWTVDNIQVTQSTNSSRFINFAADTGAANAYVVAPDPAISAYTTGDIVTLIPANANTTASTITVSGLAAKNIVDLGGSALTANALKTTGAYTLVYNGTSFVLTNSTSTITVASGGTGATTFTDGGVIIGNGTGALQVTSAGTSGQVLTSNGAGVDPTFQSLSAYGVSLDSAAIFFDDMFYVGSVPSTSWNSYTSGAGAAVSVDVPSSVSAKFNTRGFITLSTGTTSSGYAGILSTSPPAAGTTGFFLGDGQVTFEAKIIIPTISTGAQRFQTRIGFTDTPLIASTTEGIYFRQVENVNSGNWVCVAVHSGTETTINTSVAGSTSETTFKIVVNSALSSVEFFIDGTSQGTISTNLPTTSNNLLMGVYAEKSVGGTNRDVTVDYVKLSTTRT